jgi:hypothetical protein
LATKEAEKHCGQSIEVVGSMLLELRVVKVIVTPKRDTQDLPVVKFIRADAKTYQTSKKIYLLGASGEESIH